MRTGSLVQQQSDAHLAVMYNTQKPNRIQTNRYHRWYRFSLQRVLTVKHSVNIWLQGGVSISIPPGLTFAALGLPTALVQVRAAVTALYHTNKRRQHITRSCFGTAAQ